MLRVYLSGTMSNRVAEQVAQERKIACDLLVKHNMFGVDPALAEHKFWKSKQSKISTTYPEDAMRAFVHRDMWLIRRCDALLVLTGDSASDGTWWEMAYAKFIGLPVIMISPKRFRKELMGWSNIMVDHLSPDLNTAVRILKEKYLPKDKALKDYFDAATETTRGFKKKEKTVKKRVVLPKLAIPRVLRLKYNGR